MLIFFAGTASVVAGSRLSGKHTLKGVHRPESIYFEFLFRTL